MKKPSLLDQVVDTLGGFAKRNNFTITVRGDLDDSRGATVIMENEKLKVSATRERTCVGNEETIRVHCKVRPRPRAHLKTYSVGDLSAFVQGMSDSFPLRSFSADAEDLLRYEDNCLNIDLLNSEEMRMWKVDASRRQFGQKPIRSKTEKKRIATFQNTLLRAHELPIKTTKGTH